MVRERYVDQVGLLVDILPAVEAEEDFALKGGTAINLFYRDLPRLSVDVDLTFFPASSNRTVVISYLIHSFFIPCDIFSFLSVDGRLCTNNW